MQPREFDKHKIEVFTHPFALAQVNRSNEMHLDAQLHRYFLQAQGGRLYPEHIPVNTMERVLDVGCGAGEWIFDLAKRYPRLHIYGIDSREEALQQARVRRSTSNAGQVELRRMGLAPSWPIPDHYFDFVHMWHCARFIAPLQWPCAIQECIRVLGPGGWLSIVELAPGDISSPAIMTLQRAMAQVKGQYGMDVGGSTEIAPHLYGMLLQAQLEEVAYDLHAIDLGFMGGNSARMFLAEIVRQAVLVTPFVVQQELLSRVEFDELIDAARTELQAPDLCGWAMLISAYGKRGEV
jgi:ubiquinone/menaquinone biosynthesis C-methylase UbiE